MVFRKLKSFYKDLPIRRKLLLILYIQIIIPLVLIGYLSYKNSENIIKKKSTDYSQDILRMIGMRLNDYVNNLTLISQDLLYDRNIYNILNKDSALNDPLTDYENEGNINRVLKKILLSRSEIQSICFVSNNGAHYFADNNREKVSIMDVLREGDMLAKARKSQGRAAWYLDSTQGKVGNIFLVRTVYNMDNFKEIGLMVILIRKEFLEAVYQDLVNDDMQNIAIISADNERIVSRNSGDTYLHDSLLADIQGKSGYIINSRDQALISFVCMEEPDWKIVSYTPLLRLFKEIDALRKRFIMLCILSVVLLSILSLYIALDFINPINRLVKGMQKVQKGGDSVYIQVDRKDELGYLNKAFNTMSEEINHLVTWIYREQITRKEAEIKALQSQINPHFLFNTLESINWMAQLNHVPEISETVTDLSSLMEASIGRDDRLITLEEEFAYTDKYIALLRRRFEDRIELVKQVQRETLKVKIPRLLIQPLIENAVYHGIEKCRGKGVVTLRSYIHGGILIIEVMDNGAGMEADDLTTLNERLDMDNDTYFKSLERKKNKSIGIENVNRRIKLFYGERYGLTIESRQGEYTRVVVTIPMDQEEKKEGYYVQGIDYR